MTNGIIKKFLYLLTHHLIFSTVSVSVKLFLRIENETQTWQKLCSFQTLDIWNLLESQVFFNPRSGQPHFIHQQLVHEKHQRGHQIFAEEKEKTVVDSVNTG